MTLRKTQTSPDGIKKSLSNLDLFNTTIFQGAIYWDLGLIQFGRKFKISSISSSKEMELKILASLCLCRRMLYKLKRITLKVSPLKLHGWLNQEKVILLSQLPSDPQVRPSCTLHMLNGFKVIETFPWNLTSGPILSDGSSNTLLLSSELGNFYGRKGIQLMLLLKKLKRRCLIIFTSIVRCTQNCWLFQFAKVSKLNLKNSQEVWELQQLKLGFLKMEELFSQLHLITWVKILPKCSK